jgi:CDP-diacylglycerol--serine O-phosphatidyltransferase
MDENSKVGARDQLPLPNLFTTAAGLSRLYAIIAAANGDFVQASVVSWLWSFMDDGN